VESFLPSLCCTSLLLSVDLHKLGPLRLQRASFFLLDDASEIIVDGDGGILATDKRCFVSSQ